MSPTVTTNRQEQHEDESRTRMTIWKVISSYGDSRRRESNKKQFCIFGIAGDSGQASTATWQECRVI